LAFNPFLTLIGPELYWHRDQLRRHTYRLLACALIIVFASVLSFILGLAWLEYLVIGLSILLIGSLVGNIFHKKQRRFKPSFLAHLGLALSALGVTVHHLYSVEKDVLVNEGEVHQVGTYSFKIHEFKESLGANYQGVKAEVSVLREDKNIGTVYPEKRFYMPREVAISETAIIPGFVQDIYVALGDPLDDESWSMRIYLKPGVRWIWVGAVLIALASFWSALKIRKYP
jgi:cytochrome c-type biogenesis protein CcmF